MIPTRQAKRFMGSRFHDACRIGKSDSAFWLCITVKFRHLFHLLSPLSSICRIDGVNPCRSLFGIGCQHFRDGCLLLFPIGTLRLFLPQLLKRFSFLSERIGNGIQHRTGKQIAIRNHFFFIGFQNKRFFCAGQCLIIRLGIAELHRKKGKIRSLCANAFLSSVSERQQPLPAA